jgi:hypothetical protein
MYPAAGTVVTEMKTPDSPPTRADVRDSTPAAAAMTATMNDHLSGLWTNPVAGRSAVTDAAVTHPRPRAARAAMVVSAIARKKRPPASARPS